VIEANEFEFKWWQWLLIGVAALAVLGCCCAGVSLIMNRAPGYKGNQSLNSSKYSIGSQHRSNSFRSGVPVERSVIYGDQQQSFANVVVQQSPPKVMNRTIVSERAVASPSMVRQQYASPGRTYAYAQQSPGVITTGTRQMVTTDGLQVGGSALERQMQAYAAARSPALAMGSLDKVLLSSPAQTIQQQGIMYGSPTTTRQVVYGGGGSPSRSVVYGGNVGTPVRVSGPSVAAAGVGSPQQRAAAHALMG
jgi:hypothetical protein